MAGTDVALAWCPLLLPNRTEWSTKHQNCIQLARADSKMSGILPAQPYRADSSDEELIRAPQRYSVGIGMGQADNLAIYRDIGRKTVPVVH